MKKITLIVFVFFTINFIFAFSNESSKSCDIKKKKVYFVSSQLYVDKDEMWINVDNQFYRTKAIYQDAKGYYILQNVLSRCPICHRNYYDPTEECCYYPECLLYKWRFG